VGLATAWNLVNKYPGKSIVIMEKEFKVASQQSNVRYGVLHSGIYHNPGSVQAEGCLKGRNRMLAFCKRFGVPVNVCGKTIVATEESELHGLELLYRNAERSGIPCELLGPKGLKKIEPMIDGLAAIHVKTTAVLDYRRVCDVLLTQLATKGCYVLLNTEVKAIKEMPTEVRITTNHGNHYARYVINCAGIHADTVMKISGKTPGMRLLAFRGEFFNFRQEVNNFCNAPVFPVSNPKIFQLGPHFTKGIDGNILCGPNVVIALNKDGSGKKKIDFRYLFNLLMFSGFWWLWMDYWPEALAEIWHTTNRKAFVKTLRKLMPSIQPNQLVKAPHLTRSQAVTYDGKLVSDMVIHESHRILHVFNPQAPVATAAFHVGQVIMERFEKRFL